MKNKLLTTSLLAISILLQPLVSYAGLDEAKLAFQKGDYKTAFNETKLLAEKGNAEAQSGMAILYFKGLGVAQDYNEAAKWARKAADQGFAQAQYNLGVSYSEGLGVAQNYKEAVKYFEKAVAQGDDKAQVALGRMYKDGNGVLQDTSKARSLFVRAVLQENAEAMFHMSLISVTAEEIYAWANIAALYGHSQATELRDVLSRKLSQTELLKGQDLSKTLHGELKWERHMASISEKGRIVTESITDEKTLEIFSLKSAQRVFCLGCKLP